MSYNYFMLLGTVLKTNADSIVISLNKCDTEVYFNDDIKSIANRILKPGMNIGLKGELTIVNNELRLIATRISSWESGEQYEKKI